MLDLGSSAFTPSELQSETCLERSCFGEFDDVSLWLKVGVAMMLLMMMMMAMLMMMVMVVLTW